MVHWWVLVHFGGVGAICTYAHIIWRRDVILINGTWDFWKLWGLYSTWDFCEALGLVLSGHIKCVLAWTIEWCTLTQTGSKLSACRLHMGLIK